MSETLAAKHPDVVEEYERAQEAFRARRWDHTSEADSLIAERALERAARIEREEESSV